MEGPGALRRNEAERPQGCWRHFMRVQMCAACEGTRGPGTRGLPHGSDPAKGLIGICGICHGCSGASWA